MPALTDHAQIRLQQRGIPAAALATLLDVGRRAHDHHGGILVYFDKRARNALARTLPTEQLRRFERYLDAYAVVGSDGAVVTVGHRTRRILRC
jgi:hypothetical protein